MTDLKNIHMSPDEFREQGRAVIDWIADYMEEVENYPVQSQVSPGDIRASLPPTPPEQGEPFADILADMKTKILPGITHWQSPNFYAFFPAGNSGPSIFGDMMSAGLGVAGLLWSTSPACTELETHMLDWLADALGLPDKFKSNATGGGVIQDTASSGTLCALLAAREKYSGFQATQKGCGAGGGEGGGGKLVAYCSSETHSSVEKAIGVAGVGRDNLRKIEVDENHALRPDLLAEQIGRDREAGLVPFFVCATLGTTSSNAVDPIAAIGAVCREHDLWLHVDGAMSGSVALCPEHRGLQDGMELVDSYCFNPHKWMLTNLDCSCFWVADRDVLIRTLSIKPEYLRNQATESGKVFDYSDWTLPLGRRFRSLKLWFVLRYYGLEGLRAHIRRHIELAHQFESWVRADDDYEVLAPVPLNLVCFRHVAGDDFNEELMNRLNASGKLFLTHTRLGDRFALRFCVGQRETGETHIENAWRLIRDTAKALAHGCPSASKT